MRAQLVQRRLDLAAEVWRVLTDQVAAARLGERSVAARTGRTAGVPRGRVRRAHRSLRRLSGRAAHVSHHRGAAAGFGLRAVTAPSRDHRPPAPTWRDTVAAEGLKLRAMRATRVMSWLGPILGVALCVLVAIAVGIVSAAWRRGAFAMPSAISSLAAKRAWSLVSRSRPAPYGPFVVPTLARGCEPTLSSSVLRV